MVVLAVKNMKLLFLSFLINANRTELLRLFTWCEIQGLFHEFPGHLQGDLRPSLSVKPECFKHYCQNKLYYSTLLNWLIMKMKNDQWQVTLEKKSGLEKSRFLFYSTVVSNIFYLKGIFIIFGNRERKFLPIPGFQELFSAFRMWNFSIRQELQLNSFPLCARTLVTINHSIRPYS